MYRPKIRFTEELSKAPQISIINPHGDYISNERLCSLIKKVCQLVAVANEEKRKKIANEVYEKLNTYDLSCLENFLGRLVVSG